MRTFVYAHDHLPTPLPHDAQPAVLDDWQLVLSGRSGTIEPRIGGVVYGLLLDDADGPAGYVRIDVEARLYVPGGADATVRLEQAVAWVAPEGDPAVPPPGWLDGAIALARRHGLPDEWIADLDGLKRAP